MEKLEKIDDFEFEGAQNHVEEKDPEEIAEPKKEETDSEEEDRVGQIEHLFGRYPDTFALLKDEKDFRVDDKMSNFMASLEGYARGCRMSPEDIDSSLTMLFTIGTGCLKGTLTLDMVEVIMKGQNYDRRLEEEVKKAELKGRNANIEAKMRKVTASDGVPHLESRGGNSEKRNRGIFSLAESARR